MFSNGNSMVECGYVKRPHGLVQHVQNRAPHCMVHHMQRGRLYHIVEHGPGRTASQVECVHEGETTLHGRPCARGHLARWGFSLDVEACVRRRLIFLVKNVQVGWRWHGLQEARKFFSAWTQVFFCFVLFSMTCSLENWLRYPIRTNFKEQHLGT